MKAKATTPEREGFESDLPYASSSDQTTSGSPTDMKPPSFMAGLRMKRHSHPKQPYQSIPDTVFDISTVAHGRKHFIQVASTLLYLRTSEYGSRVLDTPFHAGRADRAPHPQRQPDGRANLRRRVWHAHALAPKHKPISSGGMCLGHVLHAPPVGLGSGERRAVCGHRGRARRDAESSQLGCHPSIPGWDGREALFLSVDAACGRSDSVFCVGLWRIWMTPSRVRAAFALRSSRELGVLRCVNHDMYV